MAGYQTKQQLVEAYANSLTLDGISGTVAAIVAASKPVYVPHVYRGGWVIRGFGFSVERIGVYVPLKTSGNPEAV